MDKLVMVPGAWLGAWVWKKIIPSLEENGCEVYPVTLTGMGERVHLASEGFGIETPIEDVLNVIKYNDLDDIVLVGHSFAGKVVAAVADRVPDKVRTIVYLDAFRPEKGVRTPQGAFGDEFPLDGWRFPFGVHILETIGKDVVGEDREWMLSKATPWPRRYANEPVTLSDRFDRVKSAYIFCTQGSDDIEQIKKQRFDGPSRIIDSGHFPMVTKPLDLTNDILYLSR